SIKLKGKPNRDPGYITTRVPSASSLKTPSTWGDFSLVVGRRPQKTGISQIAINNQHNTDQFLGFIFWISDITTMITG
ncbi:MAG: hypothetical protein P8J27_10580, partial [Mariniblastus sp.]|nr:hypothetical protein [Mariniblastus sp.]